MPTALQSPKLIGRPAATSRSAVRIGWKESEKWVDPPCGKDRDRPSSATTAGANASHRGLGGVTGGGGDTLRSPLGRTAPRRVRAGGPVDEHSSATAGPPSQCCGVSQVWTS